MGLGIHTHQHLLAPPRETVPEVRGPVKGATSTPVHTDDFSVLLEAEVGRELVVGVILELVLIPLQSVCPHGHVARRRM